MRRLYVRAWLLGNSWFDFGVPPPPWLVMVHGPGGAWMGGDGSNALINTQQSVSGMRQVIEKLTLANSGRFIAYDGKEIAW